MQRILPERLRHTVSSVLQFCLPHCCLLCGGDSQALLCPDCANDLPVLPPGCPQCAATGPADVLCGDCLSAPPHFDATCAPFLYHFPLDRLIQSYKYSGELALAPWFAAAMVSSLHRLPHVDRIVPMPLHPLRLRERGFNQSGELARILAKSLGMPLDIRSCRRRHPTSPQADLAHQARAANVRGAFECKGSYAGEHLLLVDDVLTTGATASECARTLKLHGAASVVVAVIARAVRS